MIKKRILSLCLCAGFTISTSTCYVNLNSNMNSDQSHLENDLMNSTFPSYMIDIKLLDQPVKLCEEKIIEDSEKDNENMVFNRNVVFNSYDIRVLSEVTHDEMESVLSHSHYANFSKFSNAFVDAEAMYGVNAFALVAIAGIESGWNTSERSCDGTNNITGMDVQDDSSVGTIYSSKYDCIIDLARQLNKYYLSPDSCYYNGVSTSSINIYYSTDPNWYTIVDKIGDELVAEYDNLYR